MAELFAEEGASVVLTARHENGQTNDEKLEEVVDGIRSKGQRAVGVMADVCSTEDTKKVFDTALKEFGDVDILINNKCCNTADIMCISPVLNVTPLIRHMPAFI